MRTLRTLLVLGFLALAAERAQTPAPVPAALDRLAEALAAVKQQLCAPGVSCDPHPRD